MEHPNRQFENTISQLGYSDPSIDFGPNGDELAIGGRDGTIRIWESVSTNY